MNTIKFINKIFNTQNQNNYPENCSAFIFHKIYFEINKDYFDLDINLAKQIFIKRYCPINCDFNIDNFFMSYFDVNFETLNKEEVLEEKNISYVSAVQVLFDKLFYIDFKSFNK